MELLNNRNSFEQTPTLYEIAEKIETLEDRDELRTAVREFLEHFESDIHLNLSSNVTELYGEMANKNLLARVEGIKRTIGCLVGKEPIEVGAGDTHYANSVTADLDGLRIAMAEAEALGPIKLLVGLDVKALISFTNDHLQVSEIDDNEFDLRDTGLRKAYCRHVSGHILPEDIKYVVLRIPRVVFPENMLLPQEKTQEGRFIFRGGRLPETEILSQAA